MTFFSPDCFHPSKKMHFVMAYGVWNTMVSIWNYLCKNNPHHVILVYSIVYHTCYLFKSLTACNIEIMFAEYMYNKCMENDIMYMFIELFIQLTPVADKEFEYPVEDSPEFFCPSEVCFNHINLKALCSYTIFIVKSK